jgi:inosine-uridine nucleoside N-ribohydrolase
MVNSLQNLNVKLVAFTTLYGDYLKSVTLNNNEAVLITVQNNNINVYTLSAADAKIAELTKTKILEKVVT